MDGEVAQLAALAISANYRLANPGDPMPWFAGQRAFASCGQIGFRAAVKGRFGKLKHVPVADTPQSWLALLQEAQVERVVVSCTRLDQDDDPTDEVLPDRLMAGFAGGGSLWTMATHAADGGVLCWQAGWRAAFPQASDGRIWRADYFAEPCLGASAQADIDQASADLATALNDAAQFAIDNEYTRVAARFASALELLHSDRDPLDIPRPPGPADTLSPPARRLLFAGQRGWIFDNMGLWRDQDFSQTLWKRYARISEALYSAVTAAIVAAVNSSALRP